MFIDIFKVTFKGTRNKQKKMEPKLGEKKKFMVISRWKKKSRFFMVLHVVWCLAAS